MSCGDHGPFHPWGLRFIEVISSIKIGNKLKVSGCFRKPLRKRDAVLSGSRACKPNWGSDLLLQVPHLEKENVKKRQHHGLVLSDVASQCIPDHNQETAPYPFFHIFPVLKSKRWLSWPTQEKDSVKVSFQLKRKPSLSFMLWCWDLVLLCLSSVIWNDQPKVFQRRKLMLLLKAGICCLLGGGGGLYILTDKLNIKILIKPDMQ